MIVIKSMHYIPDMRRKYRLAAFLNYWNRLSGKKVTILYLVVLI